MKLAKTYVLRRGAYDITVEHEVINQCLEAGDPEATRRAVENNWRNAAKRLSRVIGTHGERGSWW